MLDAVETGDYPLLVGIGAVVQGLVSEVPLNARKRPSRRLGPWPLVSRILMWSCGLPAADKRAGTLLQIGILTAHGSYHLICQILQVARLVLRLGIIVNRDTAIAACIDDGAGGTLINFRNSTSTDEDF